MLNLDKKQKYLLACSFGPDSMALTEMLRQGGYVFSIAHVNYHLRTEADDETNGLRLYCQKNNVDLFVKDIKEEIKGNVEEKCREIRYTFFHDICLSHQGEFSALLVAHHQDDLIETYLLQKQRNILPHHYGLLEKTTLYDTTVIRPLLSYKKVELQSFCDKNHIPYSLDSSNFLPIYARNKIRHEVVEKMNDEERKKVLKEIAQKNAELESAQKIIESLQDLSNQEVLQLDSLCYRLYLNKMAQELQTDFSVSSKVANEIRKVLISDKPNVVMPVTKDIVFTKEYETCFFDFVKSESDFLYILDKGCILNTPYFYLDFTASASERNISFLDYPLIIRNAKPEDLYSISGYPVKVRRLFIDWKMPLSLRKRWPVILNKDNRIIYIPRYQKDFVPDDKCNFYVKKRFSLKKN